MFCYYSRLGPVALPRRQNRHQQIMVHWNDPDILTPALTFTTRKRTKERGLSHQSTLIENAGQSDSSKEVRGDLSTSWFWATGNP
jgi:hypothetical protein